MATQINFFENVPGGLSYRPELIVQKEESELVTHVSKLPFREFEFHGFLGKRRVVSFGWKYDYSGRALQKADPLPRFLFDLRARAAEFADLDTDAFEQALVTEYRPGSGIGWHRDKPEFGDVVGISLLSPCLLRFRRKIGQVNSRSNWERINVNVEPRSAYHLTGPARWEWYHSILRVDALRYAITFRSVKSETVITSQR